MCAFGWSYEQHKVLSANIHVITPRKWSVTVLHHPGHGHVRKKPLILLLTCSRAAVWCRTAANVINVEFSWGWWRRRGRDKSHVKRACSPASHWFSLWFSDRAGPTPSDLCTQTVTPMGNNVGLVLQTVISCKRVSTVSICWKYKHSEHARVHIDPFPGDMEEV